MLPIDQQNITQPLIQVIGDLKHPYASELSFDNPRLFVSCLGEDHIRICTIDNNGGKLIEQVADWIATNRCAGPHYFTFAPKPECFLLFKLIRCHN